MTTNNVDWTPEIENYIQRRRALRTAQLTLEDGDYMSSINRSYYAAFYAANALLATLGLQRSKHSAVRAVLHQRFIKPGLIEVENGSLYDGLFDQRMKSDYEILLVKERVEPSRRSVQRKHSSRGSSNFSRHRPPSHSCANCARSMYRRHTRVICRACSLMSAPPFRPLSVGYTPSLESVLRGWFCSAPKRAAIAAPIRTLTSWSSWTRLTGDLRRRFPALPLS